MCLILLIICAAVMAMYCNGGLMEDNISDWNANIAESSRIAGSSFRDAVANMWSAGRCKV